jgi:hypothetical protein
LTGRLIDWCVLGAGIVYLFRHDTEAGHKPILTALVLAGVVDPILSGLRLPATRRRAALRLAACWAMPFAALVVNVSPIGAGIPGSTDARSWLIHHCRFAPVPLEDIERLAVWCRDHTPTDARFVGPPGPKTFRLWSLRSLAFNRAASPYEAAGLLDWALRFKDHVDFEGSFEELVESYQRSRHALEGRYDRLSPTEKAALAVRQGADFVVALAPDKGSEREEPSPLTLLHVEGRYAVYGVEARGRIVKRDSTATGYRPF